MTQIIDKPIRKLYYSISEVSKIVQLKPYVLRYWETEFSELRPDKNKAGNRIYRKSDIKTILLIKKLLYDDKYTIEGARQRLRAMRKNKNMQLKLSLFDLQIENSLFEFKKDIQELLDYLDNNK